MKFESPMLVVKDLEVSKKFYKEVLGLRVVMDFGANVTLTGGLALQTLETWEDFIDRKDIAFGGNNSEVYFEEDNFDGFLDKIKDMGLNLVHPLKTHGWGQRVLRFYDPDRHIIEVGENMKSVCRRFADSGMTLEQIAKRMDVPIKFVNGCLR